VAGVEHIEGRHPVLEAMRAGRRLQRIYLATGAGGVAQEIVELAKSRGVPLAYLPRAEIDAMTQGRSSQGVVALAQPRAYQDADAMLAAAARQGEAPLVILLDGVEDPGTLGSLIRTAASAGAHGVIIPKDRSATLTPAAVKAAAGAADRIAVAREVNLARAIDQLKEKGLWTVGADATADQTYTEVDYTSPTAIVVGGEHQGLRRLVREKCDFLVRIPMMGRFNSLNASVAAAILIYEAVRQRDLKQKPKRMP
jgi:23S rRNA (guanosine2251-2'-O)-methyltransferase